MGAEPAGRLRRTLTSEPLARQVLRDASSSVQAGFNAEVATRPGITGRTPILYAFGEQHRRMRRSVARYFAPAVVETRYVEVMRREAARAEAALLQTGQLRLDAVSLDYSVRVAAEVIGLTSSSPAAMAARLARFFDGVQVGSDTPSWVVRREHLLGMGRLVAFHARDVRPAIRAHRRRPVDDVIGHLLEAGYRDREILVECVTYAAAGMVTTREFISRCAVVLLGEPDLLRSYRAGDRAGRDAVLHEVLRLHPVVGRLSRRITEDVRLEGTRADPGGQTLHRGCVVDIDVLAANTDPSVVGETAQEYCPGLRLPSQVKADVLAFGEGAHRCPGAFVAIRETDELLSRLLRHDVELVGAHTEGVNEMIASSWLRDVRLRLVGGSDAPAPPAGP